MPQYRFRLKIGSAAYAACHPRWSGEDSSILNEQEQNEMFYREKLNVKLFFQRSDFDAIHAAAFDTEFRIILQENIAGSWTSLNVARFWKTDCEFDIDNSTVTVTPKSFDTYEKVLEGIDKEFNLIDLEPPTVTVNYLRQAVIQVYLPGSSYIANYTDGLFWEEPCTSFNTTPAADGVAPESTDPDNPPSLEFNDIIMRENYGFGTGVNPSTMQPDYARIVIPGNSLNPDVSGVYKCALYGSDDQPGEEYDREDGAYRIRLKAPSGPDSEIFVIEDLGTSTNVYESNGSGANWYFIGQPPHSDPVIIFTSLTSASTCQLYAFVPFVRLLTNLEEINADPTIELPADDPFPNGNFTRAYPIDTLNFEMSGESGTTPTRWGKVSEDAIYNGGEYFVKPTSTETLMPVLATTWTGASCWFWLDADLRQLQQDASEPIKIEHAYKLADVIDVLLTEIGATVGHEASAAYSDFFYGTGNAIRGTELTPIITPKSNVLIGEYDQPAKKAPIRLREVLDLFKIFHNAYWFISESNFVLEHRHYFDNGKSYVTPGVGIDLTTALEPRTGKSWSYRTSNYSYDKDRLPERMEFRWMDNVSKPFEGYPIQVNSAYVNRGQIEQRQVAKFTSDIDYLNVAADNVSKDGFVFFECEPNGDEFDVPFLEITVSTDETYNLQNGYASFLYAHDQYHKYGLPATSVNLNTVDITATTTIRTKRQELEIAVGSEVDPYLLITSNLDDAKIEKVEQNLSSKSLKITLKHDTE